jgi:hypothetical protein
MQSQDKYQGNTGKTIKGSKLATRGTASFNGKSGQTIKIGTENLTDWMVTDSTRKDSLNLKKN